jgi:hypothetical protein
VADCLVGAAEQGQGNVDVQYLGGLQVDDQLDLIGPAFHLMRPARRSATTEFGASRTAR